MGTLWLDVVDLESRENPSQTELLTGDIRRGFRVVDRILSAPEAEYRQRASLLEQFYPYGISIMLPEFWQQCWRKSMNSVAIFKAPKPLECNGAS
jgi:hypothetical protein